MKPSEENISAEIDDMDERKRMLWAIIHDPRYQVENGDTNWKLAFEEHPEWNELLRFDSPKLWAKNRTMASYLKQHGLPPHLREGAAPATAAPTRSNGMGSLAERREIIRRLVVEYREGKTKKVDYQRAFEDHPDWRVALAADTPKGKQNMYARTAHLMKAMKREHALMRQEPEVAQAQAVEVESRQTTYARRCPSCGAVIEGLDDLLSLMNEHPEILQTVLAGVRKVLRRQSQ